MAQRNHIKLQQNISLKEFNTFGLDVRASEFVEIHSLEELQVLIPYLKERKFIFLGGGSNILFANNYDGLVILNRIKGITTESLSNGDWKVTACSGEVWHELVLYSIDKGLFGLENLSLIPGTVGAAPMQNIGAYGVEIKDICLSVEAVNLSDGSIHVFQNQECRFGYRESIFKRELKGQYFIYRVSFRLSQNSPLRMDYGAIQQVLKTKGISQPNHRDISDAIIEIRSSKLPSPKVLGNAGSFFKNPILSKDIAKKILDEYSDAPHFSEKNGVKIPAGWLIEKCGFKGYREGDVGSHKDQALVIVNYGNASGNELLAYSEKIIQTVMRKFNVELEREVNIIE